MPTTADMRQFLTSAFSDEEITTLCFDRFRPVYENFTTGMSKGQKIQHLLEHCERHDEWPVLLTILQRERPQQFAKFLETNAKPLPSPPAPEIGRPASGQGSAGAANVSGGVNVDADRVSIGQDLVGRDKIVTINGNVYIIHVEGNVG